MRRKEALNRALSIVLSAAMVLTELPFSQVAYAAEADSAETTEQVAETEQADEAESDAAEFEETEAAETEETEVDEAATEEVAEAEPTAVEAAQALIEALPEADAITADNAADVQAQIAAIDEAMAALTNDEADQLDGAKYEAAKSALESLGGLRPRPSLRAIA